MILANCLFELVGPALLLRPLVGMGAGVLLEDLKIRVVQLLAAKSAD